MKNQNFYVINSFATKPFGGNPAGVFPDAAGLDENRMQAIARQLNLVETVFVFPSTSPEADFELRYFMPERELPMAGHPTIAAWIAIALEGKIDPSKKSDYIQKNKAGFQKIKIVPHGHSFSVTMNQEPTLLGIAEDRKAVAEVFGIMPDDFINDLPIQAVTTGLGQLIVPIKSLEALMRVERHLVPLRNLCNGLGVPEAQLFCWETYDTSAHLHTRNLCPREGIEDPACGSGNGALGAYLMHYCSQGKSQLSFQAEQGVICHMPSLIEINASRNDQNKIEVSVGGSGVVMLKGEFLV